MRVFLLILLAMTACTRKQGEDTSRSYRMGFQLSAPRFDDFNLFLTTLDLWTPRADAAIISNEMPWDSLLAGVTPEQYINRNLAGLSQYYRQNNMELWVMLDPTNGLNRAEDSRILKALGKSIRDADIQLLYRRYARAMDSLLKPAHLGLALETNLIRLAAPPTLYDALRKVVNETAADLRRAGSSATLNVSVQAETAWGRLQGTNQFTGVEQDFIDFPFIQELGISSYPYFGYTSPLDIPGNYLSALLHGRSMPLFIAEGGWTTISGPGPSGTNLKGSEALQQQYLNRWAQLLDQSNAKAWFQLVFTDLDLAALPGNIEPTIQYFAYLGLVNKDLRPKAALADWDRLFRRSWRK